MLDAREVTRLLSCVPLCRGVDKVAAGLFRISTPLKYPNGAHIDVFVEWEAGLPQLAELKVSDLGETFIWLSHLPIDPLKTARRRLILHEVLGSLGVHHKEGELLVWLKDPANLPDAVFQVAQAALRVSDLIYTIRQAPVPEFNEVFTQFLEARAVAYQERVMVEAPARPVEIAFEVTGARHASWVQLLSGKSPSAHSVANETVLRWMDLETVRQEMQRVTVVDELGPHLRSYDLAHLERFSSVVPWGDQSRLAELLVL